jgi:hypothetical protein
MPQNNHEELVKQLLATQSQNKHWNQINSATQIIATFVAPLLLAWFSSRSKKRIPVPLRKIRKQGQIAKAKLRYEARLAELKLDLETLAKEAAYEEQRNRLESHSDLTTEPDKKATNEALKQVSTLATDKLKEVGHSLFTNKKEKE